MVGYFLVTRNSPLASDGRVEVSPAHVRLEGVIKVASEAAIKTLDQGFFRVRFDRCTPSEKRYLRALTDLGPGSQRSGEIAEKLSLKASIIPQSVGHVNLTESEFTAGAKGSHEVAWKIEVTGF
jgi:hypothetical protein